jgi:acetolactate synthase I/II/III large subunit
MVGPSWSWCATTAVLLADLERAQAEGAAVGTGQFIGNVITPTPDYAKLVEAYGGAGERMTTPAELDPAIQCALATLAPGRSALLDVFVEP